MSVIYRSWISSIQKYTYFKDGEYSQKREDGIYIFDWNNAERYIGIEDKKGIRIFEGDLIWLEGEEKPEKVGEVTYNTDIFENPCYCIKESNDLYHPFWYVDDTERIWYQVVGSKRKDIFMINEVNNGSCTN